MHSQIIGQTIEALELLKDAIAELKIINPDAIAIVKAVTLHIFEMEDNA
jgi:hypothetical protein